MSKFGSEQDEAIYKMTLEGGCEEFGDSVEGIGHYSRVEVLEAEDVDGVRVPAGRYHVIEGQQGFVTVRRFTVNERAYEARQWELTEQGYNKVLTAMS